MRRRCLHHPWEGVRPTGRPVLRPVLLVCEVHSHEALVGIVRWRGRPLSRTRCSVGAYLVTTSATTSDAPIVRFLNFGGKGELT